jgi:hypothetical protein
LHRKNEPSLHIKDEELRFIDDLLDDQIVNESVSSSRQDDI